MSFLSDKITAFKDQIIAGADNHITPEKMREATLGMIYPLASLSQLVVLDRDLTAPPLNPANEAHYIVKNVATGLWAGQENKIAIWRGEWIFYTPEEGFLAWLLDEGVLLVYRAGVWKNDFALLSGATFTGELSWGNSGERVEWKDDAGELASKSGFFETVSPVNFYPGATSWQHLIDCRHANTGLNYTMQIAGSFFDQEFWGRKTNKDGAAPWVRFWTSGNLNPVQKSAYVQNHVTAAKVFVAAADTHIDLLDTAIVAAAGDAVKITATISLETSPEKVFYLMRNGVEIGSAQVGSYSGLVPMPHDADTATTMSNVHFCFIDTAPVAGLNTYSVHMRGTSSAVWLNQTATGASGADWQQERATSTIILEKI